MVSLHPLEAPSEAVAERKRFMGQFGYAFSPVVMAAHQGDTVEFSNDEDVIHNVHVVDRASGETVFNVTTLKGIPFDYTFDKAGAYDVACNVHPQMAAFVIVETTPLVTVAGADGRFELTDVVAGSYTATVWSSDASRQSERRIEVAGDTVLDLVGD